MSEPVLFDRNGEPIYVGDRFVWDEPGFDKVSGSVADSSGILWDGDDAGYIDRHPLWFQPEMHQHYTKLKESKVTEPLVRMGRNDLWPRYATEKRDGRIVAKEGEKPAVILTTTLGGMNCCAYQHNEILCRVLNTGLVYSNHEQEFDLIELSPAPQLVPWEFPEIPVDHWFRHKGHATAFRVGRVSPKDAAIGIGADWTTPADMLVVYEHSEHHCGPFEPCGKTI